MIKEGIKMKESYTLSVAGLKRELPFFKVNENLTIAAFIIFGDVELTECCAKELLKRAPEHDIMITSEAKSIPLIYEMAKQSGNNKYVIARKTPKVYMKNLIKASVNSITTHGEQNLYLGEDEVVLLKGKRVLIVDDVISTGESLKALENLVEAAGGIIVGKMAVLAEGDAILRQDIIALEKLPLFDGEGNEL